MCLLLQLFDPETEKHTRFSQVGEADTCLSANSYLAINEHVSHL